ncbi:hypothetical protein KJ596_00905, partial [Patescibacteria group bacterium]|nr:hypothetical protein [Patescibacteria group bacterium]MBU1868815.1 hypothetical protein [Patescibacteria group bacterium]
LVKSDYPSSTKHATLLKWENVLGLGLDKPFVPVEEEVALKNLPPEVRELIEKRQEFRREGNFRGADEIREVIFKKGYGLVDTQEGTRAQRIP